MQENVDTVLFWNIVYLEKTFGYRPMYNFSILCFLSSVKAVQLYSESFILLVINGRAA